MNTGRMGIDCDALGTLIIYLKDGRKFELDHEKTVEVCNRSLDEGRSMDQIIRDEMYPDLKLLRLNF